VATPPADSVQRFIITLPERSERVADAVRNGRSHEEIVAALEGVRV